MNAIIQADDLIPVVDGEIGGELQPCVDARTLHAWLKSGERFADWIKKRIKTYGFIENEDFVSYSVKTEKPQGGRTSKEYTLTLDTAKELSMVENNEQGRTARRYFINCEKLLRKTVFSLLDQFNRASLEHDKFCEIASNAGRTLCVVGKQYKPQSKQRLDDLKHKVQPHLTHLELNNV